MFEETLLIIKPDAVKNKVVGKIISILEENNIDIIRIKKLILDRQNVENFYFEHKNKSFYIELVNFISSGPIIALILRDIYVISKIRTLIGNTNYKLAEKGTIREMFASSLTENAVHASDSYEAFLRESKIIFKF
ncbi:MAG TPA: nucleoside-diphosphate kinase [Candidatus Azoamicus sp. MARI]